MADITTAMKGVVAPLATTIVGTQVVRDAWKLALKPEEEYIESKVALEQLEFASSVLGGLGAAAAPPAPGVCDPRRRSPCHSQTVREGRRRHRSPSRSTGPATCAASIARRSSAATQRPGHETAEETVLAHIEFDRPELPWAFSPAPQPRHADQAMARAHRRAACPRPVGARRGRHDAAGAARAVGAAPAARGMPSVGACAGLTQHRWEQAARGAALTRSCARQPLQARVAPGAA